MKKIINSRFLVKSILYLICFFPSLAFSQVGINTTDPQASLDINGNVRIQNAPFSTSTNDNILVIDDNGHVKKSLIYKSIFRAYLKNDFLAGDGEMIYRISDFVAFENPNNDFNLAMNEFTAPVTGFYSITLTITARATSDDPIPGNNAVYGLADASNNHWVMRFSVPTTYIQGVKKTSQAGVTTTFIGVVQLEKDLKYYFGTTGYLRLLAKPSGTTSSGLGTFFEIQLINN